MEKFGFQRRTIPKHPIGQINTFTNYSSYRPQKLYYHRPQKKTTTQADSPNIIRDYRKSNQSIEKLEVTIASSSLGAKIGSSSPIIFERAANQPNEQLSTKKDIESLGVIISQAMNQINQNIIQTMNQNISQMAKEIGKEIANKFTFLKNSKTFGNK